MKTGGIILAAGLSSRMGFYKPLANLNGKPMICRTIDSMLNGGVEQVIVVTGFNREILCQTLSQYYGNKIKIAYNENYSNGKMFDSVLAGIKEVKDVDAFYILLADMPAVDPETFRQLRQAMIRTKKMLIHPVVDGCKRHPPLISSKMISKILRYSGEGGMRGFWKQESAQQYMVTVDDPGCTMDTDTPEDLEKMRAYLKGKLG